MRPVRAGIRSRIAWLWGVHLSRFNISCAVTKLCLTLQPHRLQHSVPCPSLFPGACSTSCPMGQWCHPAISSSATPFSSCPQCFPASGSFPVRWLKYWNFSFSPSNEYSGLISFRINWFDLLAVQGTLKSLLQHNSKVFCTFLNAFSELVLVTRSCLTLWDSMDSS